MRVSKLDAARRQLESAIRLFFASADPVSIHTLVGAARTLLRDLLREQGREAGLDAIFREGIRPEKLKDVRGMLVEAQNFFKHADHDADELFDFNPTTTEILLWDSCALYNTLTGEQIPLFVVFNAWWALTHPQFLNPEAQAVATQNAQIFNPNNRRGFLAEFLPLAEEWVVSQ